MEIRKRPYGAWHKFRGLTVHDRLLVAEAAVLLVFVPLGASFLPFRALRRLLNHYGGSRYEPAERLSSEQVHRVAWAVKRVAHRLPARTTCLVEALTALAMLRRRGCRCELRFGVRPAGVDSAMLAAHAWIEHDGVVVLGGLEDLAEYAVLS